MNSQVPLAWLNLTHDRRKLTIAIGGVAFAVILMFQQRGFNDALFESTVAIVRELDCDLILVNSSRFALSNEVRFPTSILQMVASMPGVEMTEPIFVENVAARLRRSTGPARPIRVFGINLEKRVFLDGSQDIRSQASKLRHPNSALMDRLSKSHYGFALGAQDGLPQTGELNGKAIQVVGTFENGCDFANDGNLLMSKESFSSYFGYRAFDPLSVADLGIVRVARNQSVLEVAKRLRKAFEKDEVAVLTRQQFIDKEIRFWSQNTPIGPIFMVGVIIGFVVGVIICYQILANDISEHMGEFATLKAMGYTNRYFFAMVIRQAVYLAMLGFIPGLLFSLALFKLNSSLTGLIMRMTLPGAGLILVATLVMCIVSGLLALRKLLTADPASLF